MSNTITAHSYDKDVNLYLYNDKPQMKYEMTDKEVKVMAQKMLQEHWDHKY